MDFYETKQNLIWLAKNLLNVKPKELNKDINLEGKFDYIGSDVHGVMGLSPQEQMEIENLNYNRDEQGRDYFSSFLTIAIQAGVVLGHAQKENEINDLKDRLKDEKTINQLYNQQNFKLSNELATNIMPKGSLENEIKSLRQENMNLKSEIYNLKNYKNMVDDIIKRVNFLKKL